VGLYAALFMLRKSALAERGALDGPSVVKEPHARLFFGLPNALFGSLYFPFVVIGVWFFPPALHWFVIAAVAAAAATSLFLAYSLLFITKRECPYCWTGHAVNALLLVLVPAALSG
jgi:uncharacterized membrane protein